MTRETAPATLPARIEQPQDSPLAAPGPSRSKPSLSRKGVATGATATGASATGATALGNDQPVQRFWRDAHAGRVHAANDPERAYQIFGNNEFGLPPGDTMV